MLKPKAYILLLLFSLLPVTVNALERIYYIAAEEAEWDYAPANRDLMMGTEFSREAKVFVQSSDNAIGKVYKKALYREYSDGTFQRRKARPQQWRHLGNLGPLIHAEVGDTIKVVFKNMARRPYSIHPHGVFYEKRSEGAPYADGTSGKDKADDRVAPGKTHIYIWEVPERAGPGPADPSSIAWLYHSHVNSVKDSNSGLVGAIIVTAAGKAKADGSPKGVDKEFVNLFTIADENESWYLDDNIKRLANPGRIDRGDEAFIESNLMHVINGYVYGNLPGLEMRLGERTRWYLLALGSEVDLHTPHWHGNTGLLNGARVDTVELLPASMKVVDMVPDAPGIWMYHCHVNDHITAGMTALYKVLEK